MKHIIITFIVLISAHIYSAKKVLLINGLNGGLVPGVNAVNPVVLGGLNPQVLAGGPALIGQPQLPQILPAAPLPPFVFQQPQVVPGPFAAPNVGPQFGFPFLPNGGLPNFIGGIPNQPAIIPAQQQVAVGQGPQGNNPGLGQGVLNRLKRSYHRRTTMKPVTQKPTPVSTTVSANVVE